MSHISAISAVFRVSKSVFYVLFHFCSLGTLFIVGGRAGWCVGLFLRRTFPNEQQFEESVGFFDFRTPLVPQWEPVESRCRI